MDTVVNIQGLTGEHPIRIPLRHLHGDKQMLADDPEHVHLYIRRPTARRARAGPGNWRRLTARTVAAHPERPSPTFCDGRVFPQLQHAFLACLIRHAPRGDRVFRYHPHRFPMLSAEGGDALCPAAADPHLGLHWLPDEPGHGQLVEYGQRLRSTSLRWCMLLVGGIQPVPSRWPADRPQIRGILLDATRFSDTDGLPPGAVQTGWHACLDPGLVFALNGEREGRPLPPALLPPLSALGWSLWKRGDGAFAVDGGARAAETWNAALAAPDDTPFVIGG